jgi:DNA uptake protein ComE-like DNA-binding protein
VKVTQTTETTVHVSRASCIDLAGSEDNRRTDNNKERLVESSAINKSLFVLAQCVEAISKKQTRIPYRESKMTRILSLGQNNGLTIMILNIAPLRSYHLDTLSSLNFANRTKKIEVCEAENEPIYRHLGKPLAATSSLGGGNIARQPLRPLTAAHNANLHDRVEVDKKKTGEKPVKAFSVYSDSRKSGGRTPNLPAQNQTVRRTEAIKRAADAGSAIGRPAKTFKAADSTARYRPAEPGLTKESIEALIAQRIDEKLAEKALQDASAAPALSEELQRRLDNLEHRIDAKDGDEKSQGLQFMLMAKQHRARGEDASALRMLQMAQPFFSGNEKLKAKITACEDRIRAKKEAERDALISAATESAMTSMSSTSVSVPPQLNLLAPLKPEKKSKVIVKDDEEDDEFAPVVESEHDASYASDTSFKFKNKKAARKPRKMTKKLPVFRDTGDNPSISFATPAIQSGEQSPRTTQLLRIINSRDINQIKALKGVGTKKADAIVSCLFEQDNEEVRDLESLALLKGVGERTVENMRTGLSVDYEF